MGLSPLPRRFSDRLEAGGRELVNTGTGSEPGVCKSTGPREVPVPILSHHLAATRVSWEITTMSTFENDDYKWRETYFVLFDAAKRPTLTELAEALRGLNPRFELTNLAAEEDDAFDSLTLHSPQDYAAMDISFLDGEEVQQQVRDLADELQVHRHRPGRARAKVARLPNCDGRFDILHFEQVVPGDSPGR